MVEQQFYLGDMFLRRHTAGKETDAALLYLPGLPAIAAPRTTDKNDAPPLATSLAPLLTSSGYDILAPRYPGLDESLGQFGLLQCIYAGLLALGFTLGHYKKVSVLGRSFGGLVAIGLCAKLAETSSLNKLILLSPILMLPDDRNIDEIAETWSGPLKCSDKSLRADLQEIQRVWNPIHGLARLQPERTTLICGSSDTIVPPASLISAAQNLKAKPEIIEIEADHNFSDRKQLVSVIRGLLN